MNYCEKCKRDLPEGEKCPVCAPKKGVFIEMEMPKSCYECPFRVWLQDVDSYECACNGNNVYVVEKGKKHEECPLQEVKE